MKYHGRFQDLDWYGKSRDILIGGAGGIGSYLIFFLSRIGHNLYLYDYDTVDETNMAGQLYRIHDSGKPKTQVIKQICKEFSDHESISCFGKFEDSSFAAPIMITCFDNMAGRKLMFDKWKAQDNKQVFLDGRMQSEYFEVYCVTPDRIEEYEATLFDDSEVEDLPCSAKATSHCGAMTGATITSVFNNWCTNDLIGEVRPVPFKVSYDLVLFLPEVEVPSPKIVENI